MGDTQTIIALATPVGIGALAVLRLSGTDAHHIFSLCIAPKKTIFINVKPLVIKLYTFIDPQSLVVVDEITAIKYCAPKSFTGDNMVEIICHGGKHITDSIISILIKNGARHALRGEFTRRAFLSGKLNILKAEAIHGLIEAHTDTGHKVAMEAYRGNATTMVLSWKETILSIVSHLESLIEFPEEQESEVQIKSILERLSRTVSQIDEQLSIRERLKIAEKGLTIVLFGPKNAGKSTIFNSLISGNRSIVHDTEGTTRDFVSEEIIIGGIQISLVDTAGIGESLNPVEEIGISRTWDICSHSEVILWVTPANKPLSSYELGVLAKRNSKDIIGVINKIDLSTGEEKKKYFEENDIDYEMISTLMGNAQELVLKKIEAILERNGYNQGEVTVLQNARQEAIGRNIVILLKEAIQNSKHGEEILAHSLKNVVQLFDDFFGYTASDDVLNKIFGEFCIGK